MKLGFHTISLLLHDEVTAARELTKIGYQSLAVRPRLGGLDPNDDRFVQRMMRASDAFARLKQEVVYDLDAQYLSDPLQQQGPMLAADDPDEADEAEAWIEKWIDIVAEHQVTPAVTPAGDQPGSLLTFASGRASRAAESAFAVSSVSDEMHLERLASRLNRLAVRAVEANVRLALRPAAKHTDFHGGTVRAVEAVVKRRADTFAGGRRWRDVARGRISCRRPFSPELRVACLCLLVRTRYRTSS